MKKKINNKLIRSLNPCYDPSEIGVPDNESLTIKEWIIKYRDLVKDKEDVIWLICRKEFMTDKNMRLFAVWCAREALKLINNPDKRSIETCNISEQFANNNATIDELLIAETKATEAAGAAKRAAWTAWSVEAALLAGSTLLAGSAKRAAKAAWSAAKAAKIAAGSAWAAGSADSAKRAAWTAESAAETAEAAAKAAGSTESAAKAAKESVQISQINQLLSYFKS